MPACFRFAVATLGVVLTGVAPAAALAPCPETPPLLADGQVVFEPHSDQLGPTERDIVRRLAEQAIVRQVRRICLYGSMARRSESDLIRRLALDRAEAVALELRTAGVPAYVIEIVPTDDADALFGLDSEERRVDILLEP